MLVHTSLISLEHNVNIFAFGSNTTSCVLVSPNLIFFGSIDFDLFFAIDVNVDLIILDLNPASFLSNMHLVF